MSHQVPLLFTIQTPTSTSIIPITVTNLKLSSKKTQLDMTPTTGTSNKEIDALLASVFDKM